MIRIDHLIKEFDGGVRAVNDISFHVEAGEVFGFLGPNGAGKTTTIKILTTLLRPTSGTVSVAGHDVMKDPLAVRMSFGYVGQQSGVDPALTISENMLLQGRLYHLPKKKIAERMAALLELFGLAGREGQWVGSLSGGLKRRLDIATALIHEPKLLFLDEPTIGLDPKSRADLWAYLRRLNKDEGMTLFLTTHYLDEADQLADRAGILDGGQIRIIGTPDELKDSLGHDAIHLTFDEVIPDKTLSAFRDNAWFKEVLQQGEAVRLYLENGQQLLPKVIQWLETLNLQARSVLLARPTFDDVYLKYTGKNWLLADESAGDDWGGWGGSKNNKWAKKWQNQDGASDSEWSDNAGESNQQDWQKWGEQANTSWSDQNNAEPNQDRIEESTATGNHSPSNSEANTEPHWKKWENASQSNGSANEAADGGQQWPETGEQPKSERSRNQNAGAHQESSEKTQQGQND
ncbi:MAG: ATP-binding cassette domain-containing protein [Nitrospiria bacterium]